MDSRVAIAGGCHPPAEAWQVGTGRFVQGRAPENSAFRRSVVQSVKGQVDEVMTEAAQLHLSKDRAGEVRCAD